MTNQLDLSQLTTRQLTNLLWELRGTPHAQPLYRELSSRPARLTLKPDDSDWETKLRNGLLASRVETQ
jgi:hypothetical protein